jgi:hypothetical protein
METNPEEQRGGTTPDDEEIREKGQWAEGARDGIVPRDDDADTLDDAALGRTTGSDEPATEEGVDLSAGDNADATSDGGVELPEGAEPDLKDAMGAHHRPEAG